MKSTNDVNDLARAVGIARHKFSRSFRSVDPEDIAQTAWVTALDIGSRPFVSRNADGSGFGGHVAVSVRRAVMGFVITSSSPVSSSNRGSERMKLTSIRGVAGDRLFGDTACDNTPSANNISNLAGAIIDATNPEQLLRRETVRTRIAARLSELFDDSLVGLLLGERSPRGADRRRVQLAKQVIAQDPELRAIWKEAQP